jgi:predicted CDP-diglyceride synthetase/phosphatidate cytidylyltransferase
MFLSFNSLNPSSTNYFGIPAPHYHSSLPASPLLPLPLNFFPFPFQLFSLSTLFPSFYYPLSPRMFDVLKDDFDYFFISSVLFGLIAASFLFQQLAANKTIKRAWK